MSALVFACALQTVHAEVVVLRNGGVVSGRVVEQHQSYIISLGGRNEVRVKREAVSFVCDSLQQAYEIQRAQNVNHDADERIALSQWCVRHGLLDEASIELNAIESARQNDIRIGVLRQKIAMLRATAASRSQADIEPVSTNLHSADSNQSREAVSELLGKVSSSSIAQFNKDVQTRLLHGCATSGCHAADSETSFKLYCDSPSRPVSRSMMFRNFATCFELIDQSNREQSRLLTYLTSPHGAQKTPVYRVGSRHYEAIRRWVISAGNAGDLEASFARRLESYGQSPGDSLPPADGVDGWREAVASDRTTNSADPFDPEVFNRRYGVDRMLTEQTPDLTAGVSQNSELHSPQAAPIDTVADETSSRSPVDEASVDLPLSAPGRLSNRQKSGALPATPKR